MGRAAAGDGVGLGAPALPGVAAGARTAAGAAAAGAGVRTTGVAAGRAEGTAAAGAVGAAAGAADGGGAAAGAAGADTGEVGGVERDGITGEAARIGSLEPGRVAPRDGKPANPGAGVATRAGSAGLVAPRCGNGSLGPATGARVTGAPPREGGAANTPARAGADFGASGSPLSAFAGVASPRTTGFASTFTGAGVTSTGTAGFASTLTGAGVASTGAAGLASTFTGATSTRAAGFASTFTGTGAASTRGFTSAFTGTGVTSARGFASTVADVGFTSGFAASAGFAGAAWGFTSGRCGAGLRGASIGRPALTGRPDTGGIVVGRKVSWRLAGRVGSAGRAWAAFAGAGGGPTRVMSAGPRLPISPLIGAGPVADSGLGGPGAGATRVISSLRDVAGAPRAGSGARGWIGLEVAPPSVGYEAVEAVRLSSGTAGVLAARAVRRERLSSISLAAAGRGSRRERLSSRPLRGGAAVGAAGFLSSGTAAKLPVDGSARAGAGVVLSASASAIGPGRPRCV